MNKPTFFQSPLNTTYGPIVHYRSFDALNPWAHFCMCGQKPSIKQIDNKTHVYCTCSDNSRISHEKNSCAINQWNASSLSQFPCRIASIPFTISTDMEYDPVVLRKEAISRLAGYRNKDSEIANALKYVIAWCNWLTSSFSVLSEEEMDKAQTEFHKAFKEQCWSQLNIERKLMLGKYNVIHKRSDPDKRFYCFIQRYCPDIFHNVIATLPHPTSVKSKQVSEVIKYA